MTGKYALLGRYLYGLTTNRWEVAFRDVETVIGAPLPRSAREHHDAWWANDGSHVQARAWMDVGSKTRDVDFQREVISFYREGTPVVRSESGRPRNHALLPSRSTQSETPVREREHFASEVTELMFGEKRFLWLDFIKPETRYDGLPREYTPQDDYNKAARRRLNSHGHEPFYRFSVLGLPTNSTDSRGDTSKTSVGSDRWLLQTWKRRICQKLPRHRELCRVRLVRLLANMWSSFIAGLCAISLTACGEVDKWELNCEDGISAFVHAQFFVKDRLISPSSADFPTTIRDSATYVFEVSRDPPNTCTWSVSSYVDSQNAFGAMLRTYYSVKLTYRSSTDSWILKELDRSKGR